MSFLLFLILIINPHVGLAPLSIHTRFQLPSEVYFCHGWELIEEDPERTPKRGETIVVQKESCRTGKGYQQFEWMLEIEGTYSVYVNLYQKDKITSYFSKTIQVS